MKAVIIGGSSGIGLAIAKEFISRGYDAEILDVAEPDASLEAFAGNYNYQYCNLLDFDDDLFEKLAADPEVMALMITAGFGRVAEFEYLHTAEIKNLIQVNSIAGITLVRKFYKRIKAQDEFFCGMMGSIAGLVSSPMFSVYAASKAAVCRFIESVNIELEAYGTMNRILNVSPGSIKGTKFNGASETQVCLTVNLAKKIVEEMLEHKELYIPEYEETYKGVLERYRNAPHEFGLRSYQYKKASGRVFNEKRVKIGYLSGTFDLFHIGHLNILKRAKQNCDYLIVGVHPSAAHKGKETFIPLEERKQIVSSVKYVDKVITSLPEDSDVWDLYHYDRLFVGSDYKGTERFNRYEEYFKDKGVEIIYFPYTKGTSSTQIRKAVLLKSRDISEDKK